MANKAYLSITSYMGMCPGAVHHYGQLRLYGDGPTGRSCLLDRASVDVTQEIDSKIASALNAAERIPYDSVCAYVAGDRSSKFMTRESLIACAKIQAVAEFGSDIALFIGHPAYDDDDMERLL